MSHHDDKKMDPHEVNQQEHAAVEGGSYPGGDNDGEMADDIHPEKWEAEWRPTDKAEGEPEQSNPSES